MFSQVMTQQPPLRQVPINEGVLWVRRVIVHRLHYCSLTMPKVNCTPSQGPFHISISISNPSHSDAFPPLSTLFPADRSKVRSNVDCSFISKSESSSVGGEYDDLDVTEGLCGFHACPLPSELFREEIPPTFLTERRFMGDDVVLLMEE